MGIQMQKQSLFRNTRIKQNQNTEIEITIHSSTTEYLTYIAAVAIKIVSMDECK